MNELMDVKKRSYFAIIAYLIVYLVIGSILTVLLIKHYVNDLYDYKTIMNATTEVSGVKELDRIAAAINTYSMVLIYVPLAIILTTIMFLDLKEDCKKIKEKPLFFTLLSIIGGISFFLISIGLSKLSVKICGETSTNETVLESVFNFKKYGVIMLLVTSICGPIVEELIYRKAIFNIFNDKPKWLPIIVSILAFAIPHMISTTGVGALSFIVISIPYLFAGTMLAFAYEYSGRNVYVTMIMHFINNLVTCIILLV